MLNVHSLMISLICHLKIKAKEDQVKEAEKDLKATKKECKNSRSEKDKA